MATGLIYSAVFDAETGTLSLSDKVGNLIYSCVLEQPLQPISDDSAKPLYLRSTRAGSTVWLEGRTDYVDDSTFEVSMDGVTWNGIALGDTHAITLSRGQGVYIRAKATRTTYPTSNLRVSYIPVCIRMTGEIEAYHNTYSMLTPDFAALTDLTTITDSCLTGLFSPNTTNDTGSVRNLALIKAPLLPATILTTYCYNSLFLFCQNLATPPVLPATTLAAFCYNNMFNQAGLTVAPALPATTLANTCYQRMFKANLFEKAPLLPATTLKSQCYKYIFESCSNLNEIRISATSISASNCLQNWVTGVGSVGNFYCVEGVEYPTDSVSGIPQGWSRISIE